MAFPGDYDTRVQKPWLTRTEEECQVDRALIALIKPLLGADDYR